MADDPVQEQLLVYEGNTFTLPGQSGEGLFLWYFGTNALQDGGRIQGARSSTLTVADSRESDTGLYTLKTVLLVAQTNNTGTILIYTNDPAGFDLCTQTNTTWYEVHHYTDSNVVTQVFKTNSLVVGNNCQATNIVELYQTNEVSFTYIESIQSQFQVSVIRSPLRPVIKSFVMLSQGSSVTFVVEATGSPEPGYQWSWNGNDLPGENKNFLAYSNAEYSANAGYYAVRVTNEFGSESPQPPALLFTKPVPPGTYMGVFYDTNNPSVENSGMVQLSVAAPKGTYSAKVTIGTTAYTAKGTFSEAHTSVARTSKGPHGGPLTLNLQLLTTGGLQSIVGTVGNSAWTLPIRCIRGVFNSQNPTELAGDYTLAFRDTTTNYVGVSPDGTSVGVLNLSASGLIKLKGYLADGAAFSASSILSKLGEWPIYVSAYKNRGCLVGWLTFSGGSESGSVSGPDKGTNNAPLYWVKNGFGDTYYPHGFKLELASVISAFQRSPDMGPWAPPGSGTDVIMFTKGVASFWGGDMIVGDVRVWDFVKVYVPSLNTLRADKGAEALSLSVSKSSGLITGKFVDFITKKPTSIRGVILQQVPGGVGFFLSGGLSGNFSLEATDSGN